MDLTFLDRLLRGEISTGELVAGRLAVSTGRLLAAIVLLGALVGACTGLYGLRWGEKYGLPHVLAVMAKVPALFLLTLLVTSPSLYVFSALLKSGLGFVETVRLLLGATALALVVLASLAPVTAFFTFGTRSHPFMQLLNALFFAIAALVALRFVRRSLAEREPLEETLPGRKGAATGRSSSRLVFAWCAVYALVAAQMAWMMRPFVGTPHLPQAIFRDVESNVFAGLLQALKYL